MMNAHRVKTADGSVLVYENDLAVDTKRYGRDQEEAEGKREMMQRGLSDTFGDTWEGMGAAMDIYDEVHGRVRDEVEYGQGPHEDDIEEAREGEDEMEATSESLATHEQAAKSLAKRGETSGSDRRRAHDSKHRIAQDRVIDTFNETFPHIASQLPSISHS
jgi:hypothetical protein